MNKDTLFYGIDISKDALMSIKRSLKSIEKELKLLEQKLNNLGKEEHQELLTWVESIPGIRKKNRNTIIGFNRRF